MRIHTRLGEIEGITKRGVQVFHGIRYAEPPIGARRFKAPVPSGPWHGCRDATQHGNYAPQLPNPILGEPQGEQSEDCLLLNVYTPKPGDGGRPVMVWIHGGAFTMGWANQYDATQLAIQGDVVVVTINYRLGFFGWLDLSADGSDYIGSGANGLRDQIEALRWVRDNIADYGGDPGNVTVFGESAGAWSVNALLASPAADGLFHRAIAHSAGAPINRSLDGAQQLADHLKIERSALLDRLTRMSAAEVVALERESRLGLLPGLDDTVVTRSTTQAFAERPEGPVPFMAGSNRDEGTLFSLVLAAPLSPDFDQLIDGKERPPEGLFQGRMLLRGALEEREIDGYLRRLRESHPGATGRELHDRLWSDVCRLGATRCADAASTAGTGGWVYRFDLPSTAGGGVLGATHAAEIPFTFNTFADETIPQPLYDRSDPVVRRLAERWSNTVLAFARTGDPNGAGLPTWPQYSAAEQRTLVLDAEPRIAGPELDAAERG